MAEYKYTYDINQFPNNKYDTSKLDSEIRDSGIVVSLSYLTGTEDSCDIYFRNPLNSKNHTTLSGIVAAHDGEPSSEDVPMDVSVTNEPSVSLNELRDISSGKIRVHQTSRKQGLAIHWTGRGDSRVNCMQYGQGGYASYQHEIGDPVEESFYIDFNVINNESWVHEVILTWQNCHMDEVSAHVVTDYCPFMPASGTTYSTYGDLVIPAYPGTGDVTPAGDFTQYTAGLVQIPPPSDPGIDPTPAFWDADFYAPTQAFQNVAANVYGTGEFNLFHQESILNKIFNSVVLLGSGFQILNSSDSDQLGHGMRLKINYKTIGDDHDWACSAIIVMHRERVVDLA